MASEVMAWRGFEQMGGDIGGLLCYGLAVRDGRWDGVAVPVVGKE